MLLNRAITNVDLSNVMACVLMMPMKELRQVRLENLHKILNARFKGVKSALARSLDKDVNQTRFILHPEKAGGRWIGEKQAREIEGSLGIDKGWLDIDHDLDDKELQSSIVETQEPLSPREKAFVDLINSLPKMEQDKLFRELQEKEHYFKAVYEDMKSKVG